MLKICRPKWSGAVLPVVLCALLHSPGIAQCVLHESQEVPGDWCSWVALDGDHAAVPTGQSVDLYRRSGNSWVFAQQLQPCDTIAIDGARLVLVFGNAVHFHEHDGNQWVFDETVSAPNRMFAASMSGSVAVCGASGTDTPAGIDAGAAYVFRHDGNDWQLEQELVASDGGDYNYFGYTVAVQGDHLLVVASENDAQGDNSGAAYYFQFDGTSWVETQKLIASDAEANDQLSFVAFDQPWAVFGATHADGLIGTAYTFYFDGSTWTETQRLAAPEGQNSQGFGYGPSISGDTLLVGQITAYAAPWRGKSHYYRLDGAQWKRVAALDPTDPEISNGFGCFSATDGTTALVSELGFESWFFDLPPLALDSIPDSAAAGDPLTLATCGGLSGGLALLSLVDFSGAPMFLRVGKGNFDADGCWSLTGPVPSGLAGSTATFLSVGVDLTGDLVLSNQVTVSFL